MFFLILLISVIIYVLYLFKLRHDVYVNKDNILRALAGMDAVINRKNRFALDMLGYAEGSMGKEKIFITEALAIHKKISALTPKVINAEERYKLQRDFDKKLNLVLSSVPRYKDLNSNAAFQSVYQNFLQAEKAFDEKIEFYNKCVDKLNWSINTFPSSVFAKNAHTKNPPPRYER